eukprot:515347-Pelagomonas_calceolata.AAC.1
MPWLSRLHEAMGTALSNDVVMISRLSAPAMSGNPSQPVLSKLPLDMRALPEHLHEQAGVFTSVAMPLLCFVLANCKPALTSPGKPCWQRYYLARPHVQKCVDECGSEPLPVFYSLGGGTLTLRASGTEPKLKYYLEVVSDAGTAIPMANRLAEAVDCELVQAQQSGLRKPPVELQN